VKLSEIKEHLPQRRVELHEIKVHLQQWRVERSENQPKLLTVAIHFF
jgi:hypothetical protein